MSFEDLWIAYFGLGGAAQPNAVRSYLGGGSTDELADYDVLAQALNERFLAQGNDHPVPYRGDVI